ncbi:MAG TPA: 4Fe-4S dicluster domain-containing protein [Blastocatellia bacterium]|nr:4Fe-4S dicluster domain-containing protein [Blastocatellia bacterium]
MSEENTKKKAILFDSTLCTGCGACYSACKEKNNLPQTSAAFLTDKLSARTYTVVNRRNGRYVRRMCMHCQEPTCVSVCPVGALVKTSSGPVLYDASKCMGCRYCMQACPFNIPQYEWDDSLTPRVQKCTLCSDRISEGLPTACATVCPTGATKFGDREQMIEEAKARIRDNPGKYIDHIYGLEEVGGTSVLLLSDVPFETLGYRTDLLKEPLPMLTWAVLHQIPRVVAVGGVLMSGIWWITNRRNEVQRAERDEKLRKENGESEDTRAR